MSEADLALGPLVLEVDSPLPRREQKRRKLTPSIARLLVQFPESDLHPASVRLAGALVGVYRSAKLFAGLIGPWVGVKAFAEGALPPGLVMHSFRSDSSWEQVVLGCEDEVHVAWLLAGMRSEAIVFFNAPDPSAAIRVQAGAAIQVALPYESAYLRQHEERLVFAFAEHTKASIEIFGPAAVLVGWVGRWLGSSAAAELIAVGAVSCTRDRASRGPQRACSGRPRPVAGRAPRSSP
jgi:hypothetical protein